MDAREHPLEFVWILLSTVIKPVYENFMAGPCAVADHLGHVMSVSVSNGRGHIARGAPVHKPDPEFIDSSSADELSVQGIADSLKERLEEVLDISITNLCLQFRFTRDHSPFLVGCDGSTFVASAPVSSFIEHLTYIALFYSVESDLQVLPSQCVTRGRCCVSGCNHTLQRSKIVSYRIRQFIEKSGLDTTVFNHMKRKLTTLRPQMMMANVPVCGVCFKCYTASESPMGKGGGAQQRPQTGTHRRTSQARPWSSLEARTNPLPLMRPSLVPFRKGEVTPSGLIVVTERSTENLMLAKTIYEKPPFMRPPPLASPKRRQRK